MKNDSASREKNSGRAAALGRFVRRPALQELGTLIKENRLSETAGDVRLLGGHWYVTHSGLLRIARRHRCCGIHARPASQLCDPAASRWVFKATVYTSRTCRGFVGYGDANPFNVSPVVRGAEMRVAETRAVNRALRKAYGIGLCSIEELGTSSPVEVASARTLDRDPQAELRDRLRRVVEQHRLDAWLVWRYAADFCGTADLRKVPPAKLEEFISTLQTRTTNDREELVHHLHSYVVREEAAS